MKIFKETKCLAIDLSYTFEFTSPKEGIIVYTKNLLDSLLKNDKNLNLEMWSYSYNVKNFQTIFKDLIDKYGNRIKFYDETLYETKFDTKNIRKHKNLKYHLKSNFFRLAYFLTKNEKFKKKRQKIKNKLFQSGEVAILKADLLKKSIEHFSKASYCYIQAVCLEGGKYFSCPKFLQIHDLFTMIPKIEKLFLDVDPNTTTTNKRIAQNLNEYAKLNTKFFVFNDFVKDKQVLNNTAIDSKDIKIITPPPILRNFSNSELLSEKDIRKKYNIKGNYIFYPTQNRPNKNLITLLKALKELKDKNIIVKLVITGFIGILPNDLEFAKKNNIYNDLIIETGFIPESDIYALYKYSKLIVVPTLVEGPCIPQQILEPLKIGKIPVICSKCMGVEESLKSVGLTFKTADLNWFEPEDYKDLAIKMKDVLNNPIKHVKKQKNVISYYTKKTWDDVAKEYLQFFEDNKLIFKQTNNFKYNKNKAKYLAVMLDYQFNMNSCEKEGIIVYTKNLLYALLRNDNQLGIEFWCHAFNTENCKNIFKDLIDKYEDRIVFCDETLIEDKQNFKILLNKNKNLKYHLKSNFFRFAYFLTKNERFKKNRQKLKNKLFVVEDLLKTSIENFSKASYCYIPAVLLKNGKYFSCPKFFQIHDLFPMMPEIQKLFLPLVPNIVEESKKDAKNINDYAKLNTTFITSNVFTRDEEILKFTDVQKNKVEVVTFPPMIKQFSKHTLIEENDIRKKYNIKGNYIFYPTQNRPNKNLIVLLKALKELKNNNTIIKLVITGRIDSYPLTRDFVNKNNLRDLIIEIGLVSEDELCALYQYSTLAVVTTLIEGLGMPGQALEALSVGNIPVICSKCMGVEESLKSVGLTFKTADLNWFEPEDYKDLAQKIKDVLNNPKKHIKKQKNVISYYTKKTWDDVAKDYLKLFNKNS